MERKKHFETLQEEPMMGQYLVELVGRHPLICKSLDVVEAEDAMAALQLIVKDVPVTESHWVGDKARDHFVAFVLVDGTETKVRSSKVLL